MSSNLEPPPKTALRAFHVGQVGTDTVETFLAHGWSLAICCKACERLVEWTPPELQARFQDCPGPRIGDLVARLVCAGEAGCGSREIAVFPHLYDGAWTWPPAEAAAGGSR